MNGWLSQTDQTELAKVLSYHIVPAKFFASNLDGKGPVATLSGAEVTFSDTNGLKVNKSGVLGRNMEATNGIVHALDTVLTLPADAVAASAAAASAGSATVPVAAATTPTTMQADGHSETAAATTEATAASAPETVPTNSTPSLL
jgi:3-phosphoglycerate kinase